MSGGSQNTTTKQDVPEWLKPYYQSELVNGQGLVNTGGPQYYPGQQVADLTPMQQQGVNGVQDLANGPNSSTVAQQQNMNIESGAYLNPNTNPYLADTLSQAGQGVQNNVDSQFGAAGRNVVGSAPVQTSAMNQLATQIYGSAYNTGMDNMVKAAFNSPTLDQGTYMPSQMELQTGSGVQGQNQNVINANMNKFNYQQQLPENMLSWYSGLLNQNGSPFSSQSSTASGSNNKTTTALGGAASGAAMGSYFGPYGTAAGGLLGGLYGYFG